jgi:hypothetical protein
MASVIRTDEQITRMILILEAELVNLPNTSTFGDSNTAAKEETQNFIKSLQAYAETGDLPADEYDEIRGWLIGASWSSLEVDYS